MNEIEKAIDYLTPIYESATLENYKINLGVAIQALKEKQERVKTIQNNWISVKDRLPKDGTTVLVYEIHQWRDSWTGISISRYDSNSGFYDKGNLCIVTHWQPLPEPPEE